MVGTRSSSLPKDCRTGHPWTPLADPFKAPEDWTWTCINCLTTRTGPPPHLGAYISLKELEEMVDSSLRVADKVIQDDQSVYGEIWLMRASLWLYTPFNFQILYHIVKGKPYVVLFRYNTGLNNWRQINDTNTYRGLLLVADKQRVLY